MNRLPIAILILTALLVQASGVFAQKAALEGRVTKGAEKKPIRGVKIMVKRDSKSTLTDQNGRFFLKNLETGPTQVMAFSYGNKVIRDSVNLEANDTLFLRLEMENLSGMLENVEIRSDKKERLGTDRLNAIEGTSIYESKKNEVIDVSSVNGNTATNNAREVYNKVPGLNIWESDGGGLQLSIGARGLSPSRSANFNMRQNGYDISADAIAYPESYYTPPVEALDEIEIVRGAASLQYGPQFGGMINYKFKEGPEDKKVEVNTRQTYVSYDLFNSFNSVGGTIGDFNYYTVYQYKSGCCWRENTDLEAHTTYSSIAYAPNENLRLKLDYTYKGYLSQQPAGLTFDQFLENPRQSTRNRNWFRINWNVIGLNFDYDLSSKTRLNLRGFGLYAGRSSLGVLTRINRADLGENRTLLTDDYRNFGFEGRLLHRYRLFKKNSALVVGGRLYNGLTHRRQGFGNAKSGPDFDFIHPNDLEGSDYHFPGQNYAVFAENLIDLTEKISITPGIRVEYINTLADGYYKQRVTNRAGEVIVNKKIQEEKKRERAFTLLGMGASYRQDPSMEIYTNFSQNYRAVTFNDIRVDNPNIQVDSLIRDERGFNFDLGVRGRMDNIFNYDISGYLLYYHDKIGSILKAERGIIRFRTNIADSRTLGIEAYGETNLMYLLGNEKAVSNLKLHVNFTLQNGRYIQAIESSIDGNQLEMVPPVILRNGLKYEWKNLELGVQYAYTHQHYSDATNAKETPSAIVGIIPSYDVMDFSAAYSYKRFKVEGGVNNLTNNMYFTRRATGYPGPGIIPAEGRNFYFTLQVKI